MLMGQRRVEPFHKYLLMLPEKEKGSRQQQPSPAYSDKPALPFGSYSSAPGASAGARGQTDRESKPTHPTLVYHSVYCPGKGKGWKRRRSYKQTKKLQVQEMSLGMPWSWAPGLTDGENRN